MRITKQNLIVFPEYENVFYDDIENHKKYFLPICSLNLNALDDKIDQWVHFVSAKEIYQGQVGEKNKKYFTRYTQPDLLGFEVIDGKYKFDADWRFFSGHDPEEFHKSFYPDPEQLRQELFQARKSMNFGGYTDAEIMKRVEESMAAMPMSLADVYDMNQHSYETAKEYYARNGEIYPFTLSKEKVTVEYYEKIVKSYGHKSTLDFPAHGKVLDDLKGPKKRAVALKLIKDSNLDKKILSNNGMIDKYIGRLKGYYFQRYSADNVNLLYDDQLKKAVIALEHT